MLRFAAVVSLSMIAAASPAWAADRADVVPEAAEASADPAAAGTLSSVAQARNVQAEHVVLSGDARTSARPVALPGLYAMLIALQAYDGYSTLHGLALGAREANDTMHGVVESPTAMWGVKAAAAVTPMLIAEHLWRHHNRAGAIATMVVANSVAVAVAANNARVLHQLAVVR